MRNTAGLLALALAGGACAGSAPHAKAPQGGGANASATADVSAPTLQEEPGSVSAAPPASVELSGGAKDTYDRGFQAWMSGDLNAAKLAFSEAASQAPSAAAPRYSLGCVLERLGATQEALDAYRSAYATNPTYEAAIGAYAMLLARAGHTAEAEQFLGDKRAALPDSLAPTTFLAEVKSIEGDSPGCQLLAQQVLAKQPDSKDAMVVIARDYYRNHRWDLARYALQAILEGADDGSIPPRDKRNGVALLLRGLIERETGQRKQAIVDFEQSSERRPDLFEAHVNLGEMKLEAGNATEAQGPLEKAVHFGPNVAVAHLDLGDCYRLLGRPADAKKELVSALGMDSTLVGAHYDLGLLYLFSPSVPGMLDQDDQLAKAIQEFEAYKSMRSAKTTKGTGDDVDELLNTAKRKQSELQLKKQAASAAAPANPSPASAAPTGAPPPPAPAPPASGEPAPVPSGGGTIVRELPQ
jgi:tetratricopeptide (TPR) repeat protein